MEITTIRNQNGDYYVYKNGKVGTLLPGWLYKAEKWSALSLWKWLSTISVLDDGSYYYYENGKWVLR